MAIQPLTQNTLADRVTDRIRRAIITGEFSPGSKLVETTLARQLGVSRSPVREALHRLEREGVVVQDTGRTSRVWKPCAKDVEEIVRLRSSLESLAVEQVIDELTEEDFSNLERILDTYEEAMSEMRLVDVIHTDREFHEYICARAGYSRLIDFWRQIMTQWEVLNHFGARRGTPISTQKTSVANHRLLLKALKERNLDRVLEELCAHCESGKKFLKRALQEDVLTD